MDKYTEYILDQIQTLRNEMVEEPVDESKCDYAINFLLKALVKYQETVQA